MHEGRVVQKCYMRRGYFGNFVHLKATGNTVIIKHNYTVEKKFHVIVIILAE